MRDLIITVIQSGIFWEDIDANIQNFNNKINMAEMDTDIIILPEMFTTGFTRSAEKLSEAMDGKTVNWLKQKSIEKNVHILGSIIVKEYSKYFNRLIWAKPDGKIETYDKKHLFRYAGEHEIYSPGKNRLTVPVAGWKICPFICYDLRFPIWTRNLKNNYDVAIFIANWPEKRSAHWKSLLKARSIENQAYVVGVNRVGKDGNGIVYSGDSTVVDHNGDILFQKAYDEILFTVTLSYSTLENYRNDFPAWMDADTDAIKIP